MSILYRIKDWAQNFENNRTRDMKQMAWLPLPVKLSGSGYVALMEHKNGPAIFGVWIALLELASQSTRRGELSRGNGAPLDEKLIATAIRMKEKLVREALLVLCSEEIGWIECVDSITCIALPAGCLREQLQEGAEKLRSRTEKTHRTGEDNGERARDPEPQPDPEPNPDLDPTPPPPPRGKAPVPIHKPRQPGGLQRIRAEDMPRPGGGLDPNQLAKVLGDFAPRLPDPSTDADLCRRVATAMANSNWRLDDLIELLKRRRDTVRNAQSWGLIITIIEAACRGRPLGVSAAQNALAASFRGQHA